MWLTEPIWYRLWITRKLETITSTKMLVLIVRPVIPKRGMKGDITARISVRLFTATSGRVLPRLIGRCRLLICWISPKLTRAILSLDFVSSPFAVRPFPRVRIDCPLFQSLESKASLSVSAYLYILNDLQCIWLIFSHLIIISLISSTSYSAPSNSGCPILLVPGAADGLLLILGIGIVFGSVFSVLANHNWHIL